MYMKRNLLLIIGLLSVSISCAQNLQFREQRIKERADLDKDGKVSLQEAQAIINLSLMASRIDMFSIKSYEDLRHFPNLEYLHTGYTTADTIDLSHNPKIREVDFSGAKSPNLVIIFPPGVNMVRQSSDDIWSSNKKYIRKDTEDATDDFVAAKAGSEVFVTVEEDNLFSRCFAHCDTDGDGKVTFKEAAEATVLSLHLGGRSNIVEDYGFLRFFPKLVRLHVGNTAVEGLDLSSNPCLEEVVLEEALWLRVVKVSGPALPRFYCPPDTKVMTILVGKDVKMPSDPAQLNLEKHLDFTSPQQK